MTGTGSEPGALIYGIGNIGRYLGMSKDAAHYQHRKGNLPTFKPPGTNKLAARRESLDAVLKEWEAAGRPDAKEAPHE